MSNIIISEPLPSPMKADLPASPLGLSAEQQKALLDTSHILLARVNEIVTESLQRPALRFATSDQSAAVTNQDYFLSMIHLLNPSLGNTHKARPGEVTKAQKAHIKRQENYQELKAIRKKLYESLQNELASTHLDNLVSSIVSYLKQGYSFDKVLAEILNPKGLSNPEQFIECKNLYNQLLKKESETFASLDACLGNDEQFKKRLMEHDLFPKAPLSTSLTSSGDLSLGWLDEGVEDTSSGSSTPPAATLAPVDVPLTQEQEEKLNELKTLRALLNTKWTPALSKEVLECGDNFHDITQSLFLALHPEVPPRPIKTAELVPYLATRDRNNLLTTLKSGCQKEQELANKLEKYWASEQLYKDKLNEVRTSKMDEYKNLVIYSSVLLKGIEERQAEIEIERNNFQDNLRQDFKDLILESAPSIEEDREIIELLITEHKRHTFARFGTLYQQYASFVNCANRIAEFLDHQPNSNGAGTKFKTALRCLIKDAHHSEESRSPEKTSDQLYRNKLIMGFEQPGSIPEDQRQIAIIRINQAMRNFMGEEKVKDFQRAHTLPFPAMFAWKNDKMQEHLNRAGFLGKADHKEIRIGKDFFIQFKEGKISEEQSLRLIEQHMAEQKGNPTELAYYGLNVLKYFYLKVFSETEFLPDFMNQELDHLSEWALKAQDLDYKKELAHRMADDLLRRNGKVSKEDVVIALERYLQESLNATQKDVSSVAESAQLSRLSKLVRMICLIQVRQSLLTNTQSLASIQSKEDIQNTWRKAASQITGSVS